MSHNPLGGEAMCSNMAKKSTATGDLPFTPVEFEVIGLKALTNCLDSMMNHEVLSVRGSDPNTEIMFKSLIHQRLFTALVVDFLAQPDKKMFGLDGSYLEVLQRICSTPHLGSEELAASVSNSVSALDSWLNAEIVVNKVWFSSSSPW